MMHQAIFNLSELLSRKGVKNAVISPGSRNAPVTISLARNAKIRKVSVLDERSAGFIALGIALTSRTPVALSCTSGTALLNYGPAVAEAFYQKVPLIVLSADRPSEWIDQRDGQTIRQVGALSNFVKGTFNLPEDVNEESFPDQYYELLNAALNLALSEPLGPVHINLPFREPFYPEQDQVLEFTEVPIDFSENVSEPFETEEIIDRINQFSKIMIIKGQDHVDKETDRLINTCFPHAVILGDIISNVSGNAIRHHDLFLQKFPEDPNRLRPELLITYGKSLVSKQLKLFLRGYAPKEHWHFEAINPVPDPFQSITRTYPFKFSELLRRSNQGISQEFQKPYKEDWTKIDQLTGEVLFGSLERSTFCEFKAFWMVMNVVPDHSDLHLANSMPVRYANFIQGLKDVEVFANRGTSGIDGTNSTAVGGALTAAGMVTLLTGDLSFFYDRNAFFHHEDIKNLRIVVFNNGGGGIFRLLPDSFVLPERELYLETTHEKSVRSMAEEFKFIYARVESEQGLVDSLASFYEPSNAPKLIEVMLNPDTGKKVFEEIKQQVANRKSL